MDKDDGEVFLPPPYPTHLPSYDEVLQLSSPTQLKPYHAQARANTQYSQETEINLQQAHQWRSFSEHTTMHLGNAYSSSAPPAYNDILQHEVTAERSYNLPAQANVQQSPIYASGSLQQRIERRMATIDEEIRQRQAERMASTRNQRKPGIMKYFNPIGVMNFLKKRSKESSSPRTHHFYQ